MKSKFNLSRRSFIFSMVAVAFGIKACQSPTQTEANQTDNNSSVSLYGAGATFPTFLYLRWFNEYNQKNPNIEISYQPVGSAAGIQQFMSNTVDFGASEVTLTADELGQVSQGTLMIPTAAGSIAIIYNLPGIESGLKISRQILPDIFLGKIIKWNDSKIAELNPDVKLPDLPITVVYRSDGSGTTAAFTAHLSAISTQWEKEVGTGLNVKWPTGVAIKDNAGISAQIQQAEGTIGYVEYAFAKQLDLATVAVENKSGQFVEPNNDSTAKALATIKLSEDLTGSVADPDAADSYPIITYSWLLVYKRYEDSQKAKALREVIEWGLTEGQKFGPELGYVPLPSEVVNKASAALSQIT
ncbi:phosphate ABC transporter substrate-binding protein PstS [Plectonema cf. radiosum LEGE 06105]|uniref:Phosphate-binding protein n=1 Tax=Plectonema cf. radiosum LEGE 06105 TaxID=945769 RepID=A0A8J7F8Q8_9CYAN|nr:phosphate ABC transporter substrate-binding protein PstS [Plectonema radiosum]MBE9216335.1 phosphate ABC transporter substrate-binding protein PstS [Plectonema cf. radiosum LEGE 06105]